jgi:hypothetical protein
MLLARIRLFFGKRCDAEYRKLLQLQLHYHIRRTSMQNTPKNAPFEAFFKNESPFFFINQNVLAI